jgi:hypothetical protein
MMLVDVAEADPSPLLHVFLVHALSQALLYFGHMVYCRCWGLPLANSFRKVEKVVAHGSGQSGPRTHTFTFPIFWCRRTIQPQGYVQYIEIIKRYFTQSGLSFTWKSQSQPPRQVKTLKAGYAPGEYEMLCRNKMITNHGHFDNSPFILFKM